MKRMLWVLVFAFSTLWADAIIIDHSCTDITQIPREAIETAKTTLHIAYGHTSHGSQLTTGMTGLVDFANGGGKGLSLPEDIFAWNNGGSGGALDLHDYAMNGDCGYYPDWVNNTRDYLDNPAHNDVNVIVWSWCGQVDSKYADGKLYSEYINPMDQLEDDYSDVMFVYMTGHVDHWDDVNNKAANQEIRNWCLANGKTLYDFADIESYDPDGNDYEYPHDDCSYYAADGTYLGNWAQEWQSSHTEDVDWYNCSSAHSEPLNANQKAYAAWWLWARLAGWDVSLAVQMHTLSASAGNNAIDLSWETASETHCLGFHVWRSQRQEEGYERLTASLIAAAGNSSQSHFYSYCDRQVLPDRMYWYLIEEMDMYGRRMKHGPVCHSFSTEKVDQFLLLNNSPNPFNPLTEIQYRVSEEGRVTLTIYSMRGERVRTLVQGRQSSGFYTVTWDGHLQNGQPAPSGVYVGVLSVGDNTRAIKMMLCR